MDAAASCSKIVDNGIDGKRFLIAITGDGFTSSQLEAFHQAVTTLISGLNGIVPISWRLQDAINVYQLDTVSSQSGLSPNSALGTASCGASARPSIIA